MDDNMFDGSSQFCDGVKIKIFLNILKAIKGPKMTILGSKCGFYGHITEYNPKQSNIRIAWILCSLGQFVDAEEMKMFLNLLKPVLGPKMNILGLKRVY